MTSRYNVLSIGAHPNLAFYNWRLFSSKTCDLTVVSSSAKSNNTFQWNSLQFGNSRYSLSTVYESLDLYLSSTDFSRTKIDYIFVSATSLQDLALVFGKLAKLVVAQLSVGSVPTIIVESTNFVNLEPFVKLSMQLDADIPVLSIMSDYDIRLVGNNNYQVYKSKKESDLLYVGRSGTENEYTKTDIKLINEISDLFESAGIDVYKLSTPVEFLSYQWKFALPKITIEPLSILFEKPFPDQLQEQILAKPLISGLIKEIISVIKTMGCKLFKSYDSESSMLQRLGQLYPVVDLSPDYSEAPKLFYDFYNQNEIYLDLLVLQPILIADDFHIKTPYLEFLYAMMTQACTSNVSTLENPTSIFWLRKNAENIRHLKLQQDELSVKNALKEKEIAESESRLAQPAIHPSTVHPSPPASQSDNNAFNFENKEYNQPNNQRSYPTNPQPAVATNGQYVNEVVVPDQNMETDLEELSEMARAYVISDQTQNPQGPTGGYQPKPIPNIFAQQREAQQVQPQSPPQAQPAQQYQQYFPPQQQYQQYHPQQYPPQQNPAQSVQPAPAPQAQQQYPAPPPGTEYYNGSSSPSYLPQQGLPHGLPSQGLPGQQQILGQKAPSAPGRRQPVPMSYTQDNLSMISGMNGHQSTYEGQDYYGQMARQHSRQFKPTSRKNRKSTNLLNGVALGNDTRGMPSRQSMMLGPSQSSGMNNMQQPYPMRQSSSGTLNQLTRRSQTSNGLGINGPYKQPKPQQQQTAPPQKQPQSFAPPELAQAPATYPPAAISTESTAQRGPGSGSGSVSGSGSESSLPASSQANNLRPVPEATPAPNTPAYIPPATSETKVTEKKKKKRGFFGRKK
ncbi:hypothetical protein KL938_003159 [Ogataea parapolymorpha]|nr:hypothetical protein KL938_003159 [Ogataea parapolymorpha]